MPQVDTLSKLCGYGDGWCKVNNLSWWECKHVMTGPLLKAGECRYFSPHHPQYPMIVMDDKRQLILDNRKQMYDVRYSHLPSYGEAEPGMMRAEEEGRCDFCKLPTYFWDTNISVYICSTQCRKAEYKKLDKE